MFPSSARWKRAWIYLRKETSQSFPTASADVFFGIRVWCWIGILARDSHGGPGEWAKRIAAQQFARCWGWRNLRCHPLVGMRGMGTSPSDSHTHNNNKQRRRPPLPFQDLYFQLGSPPSLSTGLAVDAYIPMSSSRRHFPTDAPICRSLFNRTISIHIPYPIDDDAMKNFSWRGVKGLFK